MTLEFMRSKMALTALAAAAGLTLVSTVAYAQRDPAYQAARESGQVGEKADGYLGFVTPPTAEVKALVDDINIKRKQAYIEKAG
ncbi:MAG: hypothetical protein RLZZ58_278, partial [Pseudomonadota bacterium]